MWYFWQSLSPISLLTDALFFRYYIYIYTRHAEAVYFVVANVKVLKKCIVNVQLSLAVCAQWVCSCAVSASAGFPPDSQLIQPTLSRPHRHRILCHCCQLTPSVPSTHIYKRTKTTSQALVGYHFCEPNVKLDFDISTTLKHFRKTESCCLHFQTHCSKVLMCRTKVISQRNGALWFEVRGFVCDLKLNRAWRWRQSCECSAGTERANSAF